MYAVKSHRTGQLRWQLFACMDLRCRARTFVLCCGGSTGILRVFARDLAQLFLHQLDSVLQSIVPALSACVLAVLLSCCIPTSAGSRKHMMLPSLRHGVQQRG